MRLRDLPGLAAKADKLYQQLKDYAERLPRKRRKKGSRRSPYTHARR